MALNEFELINRFFFRPYNRQTYTQLGIGDDCALMSIPEGYQLAVTTDTMVEQVHFFSDVEPHCLGHKLLAVNLSDLAATGAKPIAVSLALTLPNVNVQWLTEFANGFWRLADRYEVDLIGGDTTAGPLCLTIQAMGLVAKDAALHRSGAKPGDGIYLTGSVGDAGLGLKILQGDFSPADDLALSRFHQPQPRVEEGLLLSGLASACVDISDGLLADLGHILKSSQVGAMLDWNALQFSAAVDEYIKRTDDWKMPLNSGEDYELCFTVSADNEAKLSQLSDRIQCRKIGHIEADAGLRIKKDGQVSVCQTEGYQHF